MKRVICVQCLLVGLNILSSSQRVTTGISDNLKQSGKSIDADQSKSTIKGKLL